MITNGDMRMSRKKQTIAKEQEVKSGDEQNTETKVEGTEQTGGTPAQVSNDKPAEGTPTEGSGDEEGPAAGSEETVVTPPAGDDTEQTPPPAGDSQETPDSPVVELETISEEVKAELNPNCQTILEYAVTMAPNKPNDKLTILRNQMKLYQAISAIINNLDGAAFTEVFGSALDIMAEYPGTFADNMLFRGFNEMRIPPASRARFENILVLMSSTADKEGRGAALKAISFDTLLSEYTADIGQKVRGFYSSK